jgi:small subunit ribosomal protein S13
VAAVIKGVALPPQKRIEVALAHLYGVGLPLAKKILATTGIDPNKRTHALSQEEVGKLRDVIEQSYRIEGDLRREVLGNVKRLKEIGSYRGIRHARRLPTRGQRTKTNSRTVRGNVRKTMGSGRKPAAQKT